MIVSGEMIKLASLYAIQLGSTAEEIRALPRPFAVNLTL
jgi:hypothetical protein